MLSSILAALLILPTASSFQLPNLCSRRHPDGSRIDTNLRIGSNNEDPEMKFLAMFDDNRDVSMESQCHNYPPMIKVWLLSACFLVGAPQLANAEFPHEQHDTGVPQLTAQSTSTVVVATYASEGSGGLPFLSTFQTPGAVPKPTDARLDDRETRNRAFDEAFDQDKRDRDAYYAKMALQAREKRMQELKERRAELGLEGDDAAPRFGDEPVADMASLKKLLLQKDPSTMTPAEFKEFQQPQEPSPASPTAN